MGVRGALFAAVYDRQLAKTEAAGLGEMRRRLLAAASGAVLEVGAGTGANLAYYGDAVRELTLTEPEAPMLRRLTRKVASLPRSITVLRAPAEDLPFDDGVFDVAVSTLVLCGVSDQARALRQLRRVLRPGGTLLFLEHVRSDDPRLARRQQRMNPINRFVVGCECTRPTLDSIEAAGFVVSEVEHETMPLAPSFVRPLVVGTATTPVPAPGPAQRQEMNTSS
ncbi:MAG TPA: class I SAM-dependent methyltransferase [Acidimicrobiales bacterium]|nr:class I SAM-dependent methyltransferase [Acidimicrobiales bacterium]